MTQILSSRYIGKPVQRLEDRRFLTGSGQFVDDVVIPDMVHMAIFRSPHAHARINSIDLSAARAMTGVVDVFSANEIAMVLPEIPIRLSPFKGFERFIFLRFEFSKLASHKLDSLKSALVKSTFFRTEKFKLLNN